MALNPLISVPYNESLSARHAAWRVVYSFDSNKENLRPLYIDEHDQYDKFLRDRDAPWGMRLYELMRSGSGDELQMSFRLCTARVATVFIVYHLDFKYRIKVQIECDHGWWKVIVHSQGGDPVIWKDTLDHSSVLKSLEEGLSTSKIKIRSYNRKYHPYGSEEWKDQTLTFITEYKEEATELKKCLREKLNQKSTEVEQYWPQEGDDDFYWYINGDVQLRTPKVAGIGTPQGKVRVPLGRNWRIPTESELEGALVGEYEELKKKFPEENLSRSVIKTWLGSSNQ